MRRLLAATSLIALGACATVPLEDTATRSVVLADTTLPPMKTFSPVRQQPPQRSNANIAADFLDLHFRLESGRELPVFTRFEGPITVRVTGAPSETLGLDLRLLLGRLRSEAGIDISQIAKGDANITIEAVSRADIRRTLPQAACFVVPNVSSLAQFRRERRSPHTSWANLRDRSKMAIFIPNDADPQEVRDCLHEELAQAIGPLNDMYRLRDSVFNDDNVHTVLTSFDMLVLRATYAPELRSGMSRAVVAARLPGILARLNPAGASYPAQPVSPTPRAWVQAVQDALGPGTEPQARRVAVNTALEVARREGWQDHRRGFSHYIAGRLLQSEDADGAQRHYEAALAAYDATPDTDLHRAYVVTQMAAYALNHGNWQRALGLIEPALATAETYQNAALKATLMLLRAEALDLAGRPQDARAVRLDSLGWARYGFGADWAVRAKMREIALLSPRGAG